MKLENRKTAWRKWLDRRVGIWLVLMISFMRPLRIFFKRPKFPERPRFLLIKLSALGDAVVLLPAVYRLRKQFPEAEIVFLGGTSNRAIVEALRIADKFVPFTFRDITRIQRENFTAVLDFDQWVRTSALIASTCRSPLTLGFKSKKQYRHYAFERAVPFDSNIHTGANFWHLVEFTMQALGRPVSDEDSFEKDTQAVRAEVRKDLPQKAIEGMNGVIVVHPGCGEHGTMREWPIENWQTLIRDLKAKDPQAKVVVTGSGAYEREMAKRLEAEGAESLIDRVEMSDMLSILSMAKKVYSGNTGLMHLASLLTDNLVALNGPTNLTLWKPLWGGQTVRSPVSCAPCLTWGYDYGCADPVCMKAIFPKDINA